VATPIHRSICCATAPTKAANQSFGFYKPDYSPRKAAIYLHNLTTILADKGTLAKPGQLDFAIVNATQDRSMSCSCSSSDGTFQLIVWGERLRGQDRVMVKLGITRACGKRSTIQQPR